MIMKTALFDQTVNIVIDEIFDVIFVEYYVLLEISNKGVDSSTNCDLTMRFVALVVGIELNPLSHLIVMLVSFYAEVCFCVYLQYLFSLKLEVY